MASNCMVLEIKMKILFGLALKTKNMASGL